MARHAGVSRATVSRVVNGDARVAEATRRSVQRVVDQLGYAPNQAARSLAGHRTDTVALVVSEPNTRLFTDPFFAGTVRGIAAGLESTRYQLTLLITQDEASSPERERLERHLLRGNSDGVLLVSARVDDPLPERLVAAGIPCVLAGRPPAGLAVGHVDADNEDGAHQAVTHLLERGRRTIATVAGPADMAVGADRLEGWRRALAEAGRDPERSLVGRGDFTRAGAAWATEGLLERHPGLDGLFVASDLMAAGALDALRRAGRRVPEDVAVVGFDDSELASTATPALTTVRQPVDELGRQMAELLLAQLEEGAEPEGVILQTELVIRRST